MRDCMLMVEMGGLEPPSNTCFFQLHRTLEFHTVILVAGDRFARPMHLAYETGVVASLPAKFMVLKVRLELT